MKSYSQLDVVPLRIGVTGHRFLAEQEKLARSVDNALALICAAYPGRPLDLLSSLAEGADRLVAERALRFQGTRLVALLPLPVAEYEEDFSAAGSVHRFRKLLAQAAEVMTMATTGPREEAYEAVGRYLLQHCDLLIALWDGMEAQGKGGTGQMVAEARELGLPLVWIHAGNRKPGTEEPVSPGAEQGAITYERLPAGHDT